MPLNLDSCIAGVFTPGNIGASSGLTPVEPILPSLDGEPPEVIEAATASDTLDYFMGALLHEAASASDSYSATGGAFVLSVSEVASAVDTVYLAQTYDVVVGEVSGGTADNPSVREPGVHDVSIAETTTATDAPDATVVSGVTYATLNGANSGATMSNGNLTFTTSGASNTGAISTTSKGSGKYYFEMTHNAAPGSGTGDGVMSSAWSGVFSNTQASSNLTGIKPATSTLIYSNGASTGIDIGVHTFGNVYGFAIDLTARKAWIRRGSGNWNASGTADPATGTGGVTMAPTVTFSPYVALSLAVAGHSVTGNFGASAFVGAVPAGFTSGWPI